MIIIIKCFGTVGEQLVSKNSTPGIPQCFFTLCVPCVKYK